MAQITGGEALIRILIKENVDTIFGYPGGAIIPIYDALYDYQDRIRHILVRHEQGATHAAEGYARASGKPGVCFATSGPGATNLVTGICNAMMDSTPLVCITGQVESPFLGTNAFQEADILSLTAPITKWSTQIRSAQEIPEKLVKAFYIAKTGRPGPVLVDITKDAQLELIDYNEKTFKQNNDLEPDINALKAAAELINAASSPFLLIGHGLLISEAELELKMLVEKADIPIACTLLGISSFPTDHPLYTGMLGMYGNYGPNVLTNKADVIIAIGMRFDDRVTGKVDAYAKQAKIIHIDIDQGELGKIIPPNISIHADAKKTLQALIPLIHKNSHTDWIEKFKAHEAIEYKRVIEKEIHPKGAALTMAEVVHKLSEKDRAEAVIVTDVGQHQMIAARYHAFKNPNSHITSGSLGTMGFALPAAVGAYLGSSKKEVIAIIGDGGFQMTIQELGTVAQEKVPIKIVILNNQYLGMVRQWQEMFFEERYIFTKMHNPDFVKIAQAYNIHARKITKRTELDQALDELLASKEAFLLEIIVETQHNVFPMLEPGDSVSDMRLE